MTKEKKGRPEVHDFNKTRETAVNDFIVQTLF
jgi:hypothetical protein